MTKESLVQNSPGLLMPKALNNHSIFWSEKKYEGKLYTQMQLYLLEMVMEHLHKVQLQLTMLRGSSRILFSHKE